MELKVIEFDEGIYIPVTPEKFALIKKQEREDLKTLARFFKIKELKSFVKSFQKKIGKGFIPVVYVLMNNQILITNWTKKDQNIGIVQMYNKKNVSYLQQYKIVKVNYKTQNTISKKNVKETTSQKQMIIKFVRKAPGIAIIIILVLELLKEQIKKEKRIEVGEIIQIPGRIISTCTLVLIVIVTGVVIGIFILLVVGALIILSKVAPLNGPAAVIYMLVINSKLKYSIFL